MAIIFLTINYSDYNYKNRFSEHTLLQTFTDMFGIIIVYIITLELKTHT